MPNNSGARREKSKKKQDKKKKTVPPPLYKEDKASKDKASKDSSSLSLPVAGEDEVIGDRSSLSLSSDRKEVTADLSDPKFLERVLLMEHRNDIYRQSKPTLNDTLMMCRFNVVLQFHPSLLHAMPTHVVVGMACKRQWWNWAATS